jgi:hypothetical protein
MLNYGGFNRDNNAGSNSYESKENKPKIAVALSGI